MPLAPGLRRSFDQTPPTMATPTFSGPDAAAYWGAVIIPLDRAGIPKAGWHNAQCSMLCECSALRTQASSADDARLVELLDGHMRHLLSEIGVTRASFALLRARHINGELVAEDCGESGAQQCIRGGDAACKLLEHLLPAADVAPVAGKGVSAKK